MDDLKVYSLLLIHLDGVNNSLSDETMEHECCEILFGIKLETFDSRHYFAALFQVVWGWTLNMFYMEFNKSGDKPENLRILHSCSLERALILRRVNPFRSLRYLRSVWFSLQTDLCKMHSRILCKNLIDWQNIKMDQKGKRLKLNGGHLATDLLWVSQISSSVLCCRYEFSVLNLALWVLLFINVSTGILMWTLDKFSMNLCVAHFMFYWVEIAVLLVKEPMEQLKMNRPTSF